MIDDGKPKRRFRLGYEAVVLIAALWTLQFVMTTVRQNLMDGEAPGVEALSRRALACLFGGLIFYAMGMILDSLRHWRFGWRAAIAFPLALVGAMTHAVVNGLIFYYIYPLPDGPPSSSAWQPIGLYVNIHYWLWGFLAWATIFLALSYSREVIERDRRLHEFEALAHRAQLRALRYQVNPHFLFNSLNAISSLVTGAEIGRAEAVLANLSDFLRASLATDPLEDIPLWREIDYERLYLDIELVRYPNRMRVEIDQPEPLANALVPSLILQPLIENAIKHAVSSTVELVTIRVAARLDGDRLLIAVSDDCPAPKGEWPKPSGSGVGLANVRQRLAARHPGLYAFTAGPRHPRGFGVEFSFPLRFAP